MNWLLMSYLFDVGLMNVEYKPLYLGDSLTVNRLNQIFNRELLHQGNILCELNDIFDQFLNIIRREILKHLLSFHSLSLKASFCF